MTIQSDKYWEKNINQHVLDSSQDFLSFLEASKSSSHVFLGSVCFVFQDKNMGLSRHGVTSMAITQKSLLPDCGNSSEGT